MNFGSINMDQFTKPSNGIVIDNFENLDGDVLIGYNEKILDETDRTYQYNYLSNFQAPVEIGRHFLFPTSPDVNILTGRIPVLSFTSGINVDRNMESQFRKTLPNIGMSFVEFINKLRLMGVRQKQYHVNLFGTGIGDGIIANTTLVPWGFTNSVMAFTQEDRLAFLEFILKQANDIQSEMLNMGKTLTIVTTPRLANWLTTTILPLQFSQLQGSGVDSVGGTFTRFVKNGFNNGHDIIVQSTNLLKNITEDTPVASDITDGMLLFYPEINNTQGFGFSNTNDGTDNPLSNTGMATANSIIASMASEIAHTPTVQDRSGMSQTYEQRANLLHLLRSNVGRFLEITWEKTV